MKALLHRMLATTLVGLAALAVGGPSEAQLSPDSRWPMLGNDERHTGQSDLLGPLFTSGAPGVDNVRSLNFVDKIKMTPVVGADGTIYVGMGWQFCAIKPLDVTDPANPVFTKKWTDVPTDTAQAGCRPTNADVSSSAAAVDKDDYVYFGDRDNSVYKFRGSDGLRMWAYDHGHEGDHNASPVIGPDGTIYFVFSQTNEGNGTVTAIKNTGPTTFTVKWKLQVGQFGTFSSPTITTDPIDGKTIIILGFADAKVRAIKDNGACPAPPNQTCGGAVLWKTTVGIGSIIASPVIGPGPNRTVYVGGYGGIYALDPVDGHIKWTYPTSPAIVDSTAALSSNGILYFVSRYGNQRTVYAINPAAVTPQNPQGGLLWKYGPITAPLSPMGGYPIIGADGVVYVGMANGVYALQPNSGTLLWKYETANGIISSPVLGPPALPTSPATASASGTAVIYIGSQDRNFYAITSPRVGLAQNSPPVAKIKVLDGPTVVPAGQSVPAGHELTFKSSGSTDANGDTLYSTWDLGDGSFATGSRVDHTYWTPGSYSVKLTVSDGLASSDAFRTMTVTGGSLTYFCDGFQRADNTTLNGPGSVILAPCTTASSLQWEENSGSMSISNQQMRTDPAPAKPPHIATVSSYAGADQTVAVDFTSSLNSTAPRFGIALRFTPDNYYVAYRLVGGGSLLRISRVLGGVETVLAQTPVSNPTQGVPFRLRATVVGTAMTLQLCPTGGSPCPVGSPSISASDSNFSGGGVGVLFSWLTSMTPAYFADNFKACVGPPGTGACAAIQ